MHHSLTCPPRLFWRLAAALLAPLVFAGGAQAANAQATHACPALLNHTLPRLQDEKPMNLCEHSGKVVLVVNTASFCGFTGQYKGLEALYAQYRERGLVVLGFPSNDFSQETGSNKDIADFCENTYGVKFPMFTKSSVAPGAGRTVNPVFAGLAQRTGQVPKWNFHKYLISRQGDAVTSFGTTTDPKDPAFVKELEKLLKAN